MMKMSVGAAWGPAVKSVEMRKVTLWGERIHLAI